MLINFLHKSFYTFLILITAAAAVIAQPDVDYNASKILEDIKRLQTLGSVLYVAAHPDDENTRLITYFTKEKKYNTGYLSLTRGDGGQNLVGPELNELLGLIRTQELLEARKIDGGKQFFSRAKDFGYSKTADETFEVWDREAVLSDMVWVIRNFKPDVLVTRFNTEPGRTHGHHTASAILALEAFDAAGDPKRFPEQLKLVSTWKPERIYWNTTSWFYKNVEDFKTDSLLKIDVGQYNEVLGKSYTEIAAESRSMHKSQGFGASGVRGSTIEYLEHMGGSKVYNDLFEGINTSWSRVKGGTEIENSLNEVYKSFDVKNPSASVPNLLKVRSMIAALPENHWKELKLQEIEGIIKSSLGLWTEAIAEDFSVVPGESIKVSSEIVNRSSFPLTLKKITFAPSIKDTIVNIELKENQVTEIKTNISLSDTFPYTHPYWLRERGTKGMFDVDDQVLIGKPENTPPVLVNYIFDANGKEIIYSTPLKYKKTDPIKAEIYRPFEVSSPVFLNPSEKLLVIADNKPRTISVAIQSGKANVQGSLIVQVPEGWKADPEIVPFSINGKGNEQSYNIVLYPAGEPMVKPIKFVAVIENDTVNKAVTRINYDHIPAQSLYPESIVMTNKLDLKKKGENIGYVMGAGDEVPAALQQIGYKVTILNDKKVTPASLNKFDAIIIGIRAFNTTEELKVIHPLLLDYVKNGGTMIVQYNTVPNRITADYYVTDSIAPFPLKLSRDRVTKEEAPVTFLNPGHPLLNKPNKITKEDFDGWVQERGLYFPNEWSKEFQPIIAFNDPGETSKEGSILYAEYGKGIFIYTGISWFRQLPAGVTGAYRLFVNLISAGK